MRYRKSISGPVELGVDRWPVRQVRAGGLDQSQLAGGKNSECDYQRAGSKTAVPQVQKSRKKPVVFRQATPLRFENVTNQGQFPKFAPDLLQVIEKVPLFWQNDKVLVLTR